MVLIIQLILAVAIADNDQCRIESEWALSMSRYPVSWLEKYRRPPYVHRYIPFSYGFVKLRCDPLYVW